MHIVLSHPCRMLSELPFMLSMEVSGCVVVWQLQYGAAC